MIDRMVPIPVFGPDFGVKHTDTPATSPKEVGVAGFVYACLHHSPASSACQQILRFGRLHLVIFPVAIVRIRPFERRLYREEYRQLLQVLSVHIGPLRILF